MTDTPNMILDAHQDIAWNALELDRDWTLSAHAKRAREAHTPVQAREGSTTLGLPESLLGRVGLIFGTIFAAPRSSPMGSFGDKYAYETPTEAHEIGMKQADIYRRYADENANVALVRTQAELDNVLASWGDDIDFKAHKVGLVMLMEGADPIREPRAFEEWYERGVRIVGPAWSSTRYSGGTRAPGPLTSLGRELLDVMGSFRAVLDLSHMSEDAYFEACDRYHASLIASHSNPRRFVDTDRALSDEMIRRLAERNGVVGIVPYVKFLYQRGELPKTKADFSVMRIVDAIDHVCQVTGSAAHVGLGTDFDGGFGTEGLPAEIDTLADLGIIGTALAARGYAPAEVRGVLCGNFLRVLRAALPA